MFLQKTSWTHFFSSPTLWMRFFFFKWHDGNKYWENIIICHENQVCHFCVQTGLLKACDWSEKETNNAWKFNHTYFQSPFLASSWCCITGGKEGSREKVDSAFLKKQCFLGRWPSSEWKSLLVCHCLLVKYWQGERWRPFRSLFLSPNEKKTVDLQLKWLMTADHQTGHQSLIKPNTFKLTVDVLLSIV